jgi:molecular chaperone DnaJ
MDHYQTLGVSRNATPDEIKKAYRKLASQHHPDKGGDKTRFQEIQSAYDTLGDPQKKQQYDNPNPFGNGQEMPGGFQFNFTGDNFNDIFAQMFGGRPNPFHNPNPGRQLYRTKVTVSLEDAYNGANHTLKMHTHEGLKVISIDVPKGVNTGSQLRYENVLVSGSLVVEFVVMPHLKFDRKGNDLYSNQSISVLDLIVGTKIQFTTLSGKVLDVTVRPNTQPYMQLRIPKEGMPIGDGGYGDQILLLKPFIPDNISTDIIDSINRFKAK